MKHQTENINIFQKSRSYAAQYQKLKGRLHYTGCKCNRCQPRQVEGSLHNSDEMNEWTHITLWAGYFDGFMESPYKTAAICPHHTPR